jgi:hypothetical protein
MSLSQVYRNGPLKKVSHNFRLPDDLVALVLMHANTMTYQVAAMLHVLIGHMHQCGPEADSSRSG